MTTTPTKVQYLGIMLGSDEHGIAAEHLQEIIAYSPVTRISGMPPWLAGVINLRGRVLPVIDLAIRFGRPPIIAGKRTCVVVVEVEIDGERTALGLLIDAVSRVMDVALDEIEPAPSFGNQLRVEFVRGVLPCGQRFMVLLDLPRIFSADEVLDISQRVLAAPPAQPPPATKEPEGVVFFDD